MTLKLVADNTVELPITSVADIPTNLRLLADSIERGAAGNVRSCVFVVVLDDGLSIHIKGENCSPYELMGSPISPTRTLGAKLVQKRRSEMTEKEIRLECLKLACATASGGAAAAEIAKAFEAFVTGSDLPPQSLTRRRDSLAA